MKLKTFALTLIAIALLGCAHKMADGRSGEPANPQERALYEKGLKALSKNEFAKAQTNFSDLLQKFPTTRWLSGAYYNLGLAYEGLNQYDQAAESYKKVVEFFQGLINRDRSDALYRLSICYEALGDDEKMILSLLELQHGLSYLPKDKADVEVPARLAAAYSRQGNKEQGAVHYAKAEVGLKKLRQTKAKGDVLMWLPKTLYSMGKLPPLDKEWKEDEFIHFTDSLVQSQLWLLRAADYSTTPWAAKASADLIKGYQKAWEIINNVPEESSDQDKVHAAKVKQDKQKQMAEALDGVIEKLTMERIPATPKNPESPQVAEIFKEVLIIKVKASDVIAQRDVRDQKTPESQAREGVKRSLKKKP